MNESQIAKSLAEANIEVETPVIEDNLQPEIKEVEALHNNLPLDNMVLKQQVMQMMGVPAMQQSSTEIIDMVNYILRWAADNSASNEMIDILETISRQTRMMGIRHKDDKMARLYRYVKLNNQRASVELQMRELYGN
jgi:hypothetical protein